MRVFVILSCYFLSGLLFATFCYKAFSWRRFLLFKNYRAGPPGVGGCVGILGSYLFAAASDCLLKRKRGGRGGAREREMEMEERKD